MTQTAACSGFRPVAKAFRSSRETRSSHRVGGKGPAYVIVRPVRPGRQWSHPATVQNQQGQPYTFSLGFTDVGTGVGCATVDGRQELVGLNAVPNADGTTVDWTSTVVTVSGTGARNGTVAGGTYTSPGDDAQIDRLHQVTCGSLTAADSLTLAQ